MNYREIVNLLSLQFSLNFRIVGDKIYDTNGSPVLNLSNRHDGESDFWLDSARNGFWFEDTCINSRVSEAWFNQDFIIRTLLDTCSTFSRGYCSLLPENVCCDWIDSRPFNGYYYGVYIVNKNEDFDPTIKAECIITFDKNIRVNKAYKYGLREDIFIYSDCLLSSFLTRRQLKDLQIEVIGVQNRPQRRQKICSQLRQLRVEYSYFPAVYGKAINVGIFDKTAYSNLKNPSNVMQVQYKNKIYFHNIRSRQLKMSYGEFGCALSHIQIVLKHSPKPCLFFEDDARIDDTEHFLIQLRNIPSFEMFDICYFQNESIWFPPQSNVFINDHFALNLKRGINCTHAYLLSSRGIQLYKNYLYHSSQAEFIGNPNGLFVNVPSDDILSSLCRQGAMISISPGVRLISTNKAQSDIWNIYKTGEKHTNVVWDKPRVNYRMVYVKPGLSLVEQMLYYAMAKIISYEQLCGICVAKDFKLDSIFKNIDYDSKSDFDSAYIEIDSKPAISFLDNYADMVRELFELKPNNYLVRKHAFEKCVAVYLPKAEQIVYQEEFTYLTLDDMTTPMNVYTFFMCKKRFTGDVELGKLADWLTLPSS